MHRRTTAVVLVAGLALAACGSDDSADTSATDSAPPSTVPVETSPVASDVTTAESVPDESAPATTEVELTASFQGVTAESIKLGVTYIDFQRMNDEFGFDFATFPMSDAYNAWSAALNADGGINGRSVEVVTRGFLPVGDTESVQACTELLEDEQVFAVIGQFLLDNALCVTETYGHPYVGVIGETPSIQEASQGRFFGVDMSTYDQRVNAAQIMLDDGTFDGKKVGVVWANPPEKESADAVVALLEDGGVDITSAIEVGTMGTDAVANDASWAATIERLESEGTDIMFAIADLGALNAIENNASQMTVALADPLIAEGTRYISQVAAGDAVRQNSFGVSIYRPPLDELLADPEVQRCFDEYDAAFPAAPLDITSSDIVGGFVVQCRAFRMMTDILTNAGGDLTPETFVAAGESIGEFSLPGMPVAFLGSDKHSAGSQLWRYEYDVAAQQYVGVGEPTSVL